MLPLHPRVHSATRGLRIPVLDAPPSGARVLHVPANYVVHRGAFQEPSFERDSQPSRSSPRERDLATSKRRPVRRAVRVRAASPSPTTASAAEKPSKRLFRALRKPQDGWTSRYLNRYISLAILSRWLVKTPAFTRIRSRSGFWGVGVAGAWLASRGGYGNALLGAFFASKPKACSTAATAR